MSRLVVDLREGQSGGFTRQSDHAEGGAGPAGEVGHTVKLRLLRNIMLVDLPRAGTTPRSPVGDHTEESDPAHMDCFNINLFDIIDYFMFSFK